MCVCVCGGGIERELSVYEIWNENVKYPDDENMNFVKGVKNDGAVGVGLGGRERICMCVCLCVGV